MLVLVLRFKRLVASRLTSNAFHTSASGFCVRRFCESSPLGGEAAEGTAGAIPQGRCRLLLFAAKPPIASHHFVGISTLAARYPPPGFCRITRPDGLIAWKTVPSAGTVPRKETLPLSTSTPDPDQLMPPPTSWKHCRLRDLWGCSTPFLPRRVTHSVIPVPPPHSPSLGAI